MGVVYVGVVYVGVYVSRRLNEELALIGLTYSDLSSQGTYPLEIISACS